jgi:glycosyltransferase involved in cell wall biosynthesis
MKKVTVLIPCYNEAEAIANVVRKFPKEQLYRYGFDLEIVVIDNNSSDDTARVAAEAGARVITEKKQGKGNAIRSGFYSIDKSTDYVVMLDGDDTYKPEEIWRLIEPLDSGFADVIIGSRMHGRIRKGSMKRLNHTGNKLYSSLVRTAYKVTVTDVLTGYFAWKRPVIEDLRNHLKSQGFAIEMEMVTKMARLGYPIYSVPISYDPRLGDSSLNPVRDGARILNMYFKNLRWKPTFVDASEIATGKRKIVRNFTLTKSLKRISRRHEAPDNSTRF